MTLSWGFSFALGLVSAGTLILSRCDAHAFGSWFADCMHRGNSPEYHFRCVSQIFHLQHDVLVVLDLGVQTIFRTWYQQRAHYSQQARCPMNVRTLTIKCLVVLDMPDNAHISTPLDMASSKLVSAEISIMTMVLATAHGLCCFVQAICNVR